MKYDRLWDPIKDDLVDTTYVGDEQILPKREVVKRMKLELEEKKKEQSFIIVPHLVDPSSGDRDFWVRIFSSDPIEVSLLPETIEIEKKGMWKKDMKQGPRLVNGSENPNWCENQQFFLNLHKPTQQGTPYCGTEREREILLVL